MQEEALKMDSLFFSIHYFELHKLILSRLFNRKVIIYFQNGKGTIKNEQEEILQFRRN